MFQLRIGHTFPQYCTILWNFTKMPQMVLKLRLRNNLTEGKTMLLLYASFWLPLWIKTKGSKWILTIQYIPSLCPVGNEALNKWVLQLKQVYPLKCDGQKERQTHPQTDRITDGRNMISVCQPYVSFVHVNQSTCQEILGMYVKPVCCGASVMTLPKVFERWQQH